jgi:hypothetical protein
MVGVSSNIPVLRPARIAPALLQEAADRIALQADGPR